MPDCLLSQKQKTLYFGFLTNGYTSFSRVEKKLWKILAFHKVGQRLFIQIKMKLFLGLKIHSKNSLVESRKEGSEKYSGVTIRCSVERLQLLTCSSSGWPESCGETRLPRCGWVACAACRTCILAILPIAAIVATLMMPSMAMMIEMIYEQLCCLLLMTKEAATTAQCVHWTVGFPCSKKSPVVATGECSYYRGITIANGE